MADLRTVPGARLAAQALAALSLASACGGDVVVDAATSGAGGAGGSGSSNTGTGAATTTSNANGTGAASTTATGTATSSGVGASGGAGGGNVACGGPMNACQQCAGQNCPFELSECCAQDAEAAAQGQLGCWDVVACAIATGCTGTDCLEVCGRQIAQAGVEVATQLAQPLGDCVAASVDAGLCPGCGF